MRRQFSFAAVIELFVKFLYDFLENITRKRYNFDPFKNSNYLPVQKELYETDLEVKGDIPKDIDGAYVRIGPNTKYFIGGESHAFDGDGMMHAIKMRDGKIIAYNNQFVRTDIFLAEQEWDRPMGIKLSHTTGFKSIFYFGMFFLRRIFGIIPSTKPKDVDTTMAFQSNTNMYFMAGRLLSLHEADLPYQIRILCNGILETLGSIKLGEAKSCTAHPHTDHKTGETFFFRYDNFKPYYQYGYIDAKGYASKMVDIDIRGPIMMHDFSITEKHAVFMDLPLLFDPVYMMVANRLPFVYNKKMSARFGIMPRYSQTTKNTIWFDLPNQYIFHVMNSWDVEGTNKVKLFACRYDQMNLNVSDIGKFDKQQGYHKAVLCEYTFDLDTKTYEYHDVTSTKTEFPQINQRKFGYPTKYGYTSMNASGLEQYYGFIKWDLTKKGNKEIARVEYPEGTYGGELSFVPRQNANGLPDDLDEDDGYLVGYVHNYNIDKSSFVIYDAKLKTKEPLA